MMRKVYVHGWCELKPGDPEPDYRSLFSEKEARRMGRLLKRAVWTSSQALAQAGIAIPDAVVIGTDNIDDAQLQPAHSKQSTHKTIASRIAIRLGAHGYNATYSHGGHPFESAFQDAWTQIALGDIDTALVGWFDEMTHALAVVLSANPEGAAMSFPEGPWTFTRS